MARSGGIRAGLKKTGAVDRAEAAAEAGGGRGKKVRALLRARLGEDVYINWFRSLEFESFDGKALRVSVPVKFLQNWIETHFSAELLKCCAQAYEGLERVDVTLRQPRSAAAKASCETASGKGAGNGTTDGGGQAIALARPGRVNGFARAPGDGLDGSPLDPRYRFDSFVVGPNNHVAHASAAKVARTHSGAPNFENPLFIHASVGMGKTHLLQAIAWEVKRRNADARILYLTAERFRFQFVEAVRSQDPMSFKDRFRGIDILLIDDLEFMQGPQTEQEFDHIVNSMLDSGRQVVVASSRAPSHIERLNDRMRSRLQRGLVTPITAPDYDVRLRILEKRVQDKRAVDASFDLPRPVLEMLAERLTESGRELEGAVTRLHAAWQYLRTPITVDLAETAIRDLLQGSEPKRVRIDDILKVVSRHFNVSRNDILSPRRHRSVVWPRQIGMYLAKTMTQRSLPEIGRRFGNRDHTTVLHAIRKIEGVLGGNVQLRNEIDELRKLLNS